MIQESIKQIFNSGLFLAAAKTSTKGFSVSKCDVGNWIFSESWEYLGIFENFFGILLEFFLNSF